MSLIKIETVDHFELFPYISFKDGEVVGTVSVKLDNIITMSHSVYLWEYDNKTKDFEDDPYILKSLIEDEFNEWLSETSISIYGFVIVQDLIKFLNNGENI